MAFTKLFLVFCDFMISFELLAVQEFKLSWRSALWHKLRLTFGLLLLFFLKSWLVALGSLFYDPLSISWLVLLCFMLNKNGHFTNHLVKDFLKKFSFNNKRSKHTYWPTKKRFFVYILDWLHFLKIWLVKKYVLIFWS